VAILTDLTSRVASAPFALTKRAGVLFVALRYSARRSRRCPSHRRRRRAYGRPIRRGDSLGVYLDTVGHRKSAKLYARVLPLRIPYASPRNCPGALHLSPTPTMEAPGSFFCVAPFASQR
jgi:hypothetical protein